MKTFNRIDLYNKKEEEEEERKHASELQDHWCYVFF